MDIMGGMCISRVLSRVKENWRTNSLRQCKTQNIHGARCFNHWKTIRLSTLSYFFPFIYIHFFIFISFYTHFCFTKTKKIILHFFVFHLHRVTKIILIVFHVTHVMHHFMNIFIVLLSLTWQKRNNEMNIKLIINTFLFMIFFTW